MEDAAGGGGLRATVIIPTTGDRSPVLPISLRSVLRQTVPDLELFVIGDGAADASRDVIRSFAAEDDRIRFFDHPKGERRGETYRHAALAEARGRIVAYLCDRDIMLPWHLETLIGLLEASDFAHTLPFFIQPDGAVHVRNSVDLRVRVDRADTLSRWRHRNGIPLSCGGHTLEMYRRLPHGWRTTPPDRPTDLYMWEQFLAQPDCRAVSGSRPTVLTFHSFARNGWTAGHRAAELERWQTRMAEPDGYARLLEDLFADVRERQIGADRVRRAPLTSLLHRVAASWAARRRT